MRRSRDSGHRARGVERRRIATDTGGMTTPPKAGKVIIDWTILPEPFVAGSGEESAFDWKLSFDPSGLPDEQVAQLLREIADRL